MHRALPSPVSGLARGSAVAEEPRDEWERVAMTGSPLEISPELEARIRARARHLWELDGSPHGRELDYRENARELIAIEESAGAGELPNPMLPIYVELVGEREKLMEFCEAHHELLRGKVMFFSEVHKWMVN